MSPRSSIRSVTAVLVHVALLGAVLGAAPPAPSTIAVPRGRAPSIDGVVGAAEWKDAVTRPLDGGGRAHFLHDGTDLYIGLSGLPGTGWGYGALLLGSSDSVLVFHASAKVGSAVYAAQGEMEARIWRPASKSYEWKEGPRLYIEEGWVADVAPRDGAKGREFRVARRMLGDRRLAIAYIVQTTGENSKTVRLPASFTIDRRVPDGWNPDSIAISPEEWLRVSWKQLPHASIARHSSSDRGAMREFGEAHIPGPMAP